MKREISVIFIYSNALALDDPTLEERLIPLHGQLFIKSLIIIETHP